MKIGEAARKLGVATHVLRHWEEVGVVVPRRAASGHRHYDEEHLTRARVLQSCQRIGLSLAEIRQVLDRSQAGRTAVIRIGFALFVDSSNTCVPQRPSCNMSSIAATTCSSGALSAASSHPPLPLRAPSPNRGRIFAKPGGPATRLR